ncbi:cytochrome P450 [Colletotrichum salicis]|uniref:Cytochrome P450 n=1 Tax=Colletotrichum salicis TaxID=1209931 RepID=A0A135SZF5_9PEZI|nr:cytochrome P450 [Colletotrichum salicis]
MDLAEKVQYFTLDVISSVGLGKAFGMLRTDSDVDDYLKSTEEGLYAISMACAIGISWMAQSPVIGRFIAPSPIDNNGFGKMIAARFRCVDERTAKSTDERSDMLASFIRHGLSGDELKSEALEQIIAGSDTTAAAIRGTLLQIVTNPSVYAKLQHEIDNGNAPKLGEGIITLGQAKRLPCQSSISSPETSLLGGDTIEVKGEPYFLPGGVCVGYSGYAMHRSQATYSVDSTAFRPERWFSADPDKLASMIQTNDLIFGHGKFMCLGRPVAQMELSKTIL